MLFTALHQLLSDNLSQGLVDHNVKTCIVCNPAAGDENSHDSDAMSDIGASSSSAAASRFGATNDESLIHKFGKLSTVVKSRGADWKHKMINYIKNEQVPTERCVLCTHTLRLYAEILASKTFLSTSVLNDHVSTYRHVSATDRGPRYRGMASVFTIGDDEEGK